VFPPFISVLREKKTRKNSETDWLLSGQPQISHSSTPTTVPPIDSQVYWQIATIVLSFCYQL